MKKVLCSCRFSALLGALCLSSTSDGYAAVFHVTTSGSDNASGLAWAAAKKSVDSALRAAKPGDQVWVAEGMYQECVVLPPGVSLYGGFAGTETALYQRNWQVHLSVLNAFLGAGPIITITNAGPDTRVDGMVVTGGKAIYGGGIATLGAGPVIANNLIKLNSSTGAGGGVNVWGSQVISVQNNVVHHPIITNNVIVRNHAVGAYDDGGGIAIIGSSPIIAWNVIAQNTAGCNGGGIVTYSSRTSHSRPFIANNYIIGNTASRVEGSFGKGGALYASNSDVNGEPIQKAICAPVIINNAVAANGAMFGAGLALCDLLTSPESGIVQNNSFVANNGSAIYWSNTSPTNLNNLLAFNLVGFEKGDVGAVLAHNNVFGNRLLGANSDYAHLPNATGINGNISADPLMVNYRIGDFRLQPGSPCTDAGSPAAALAWPDLGAQSRLLGGAVDIGAFESTGGHWPSVTPVIHVSRFGNDGDGFTWATAKRTVQGGIDAVATWVSGGEVWVAQGTHSGPVNVPAFVHLYGGFTGHETCRASRNPLLYPTVLDGGGTPPVVTFENAGFLVSTLDGFTIRNGGTFTNGRLDPFPRAKDGLGGGIRCQVSSPYILNNLISSNSLGSPSGVESRGAGIYCHLSHGEIRGNRILGNEILCTGMGLGGGIACQFSNPIIQGNVLSQNRAYEGAAIHAVYSSPHILGNLIRSNRMHVSPPTYMGAFHGAVTLRVCPHPVLGGNTIEGNVAEWGAGIYVESCEAAEVINNLVVGNTAYSFAGFQTGGLAGGLYCSVLPQSKGLVLIGNNTFADNSATHSFAGEQGGAIGLSYSGSNPNALVVANNIIAFNSSGIWLYPGGAANLVAEGLQRNCLFNRADYVNLPAGATDIRQDPQFANATAGDFQLRANSPCIDAGIALTAVLVDRDSVARPLCGTPGAAARYDIGAYECVHPLTDTDGDGMLDCAETVAGTRATDPGSILRLRAHGSPLRDATILSWPAVTGRTYGIQYSARPNGPWQVLTDGIAGGNGELQVQDPTADSARFYRLEVNYPAPITAE